MKKQNHIFISYSSKNLDIALKVFKILSKHGIKCWMAPDSIPIGSNYSTEIFEAISECEDFILLLSKDSMGSPYVSKELDLAISNKRHIFPLNLDESQPDGKFKFYLCDVQIIPVNSNLKATLENRVLKYIKTFSNSQIKTNNFDFIKPAQRFQNPSIEIIPNEEALKSLNHLFKNSDIIFISGMGGIGKSELAKVFIQNKLKEKEINLVSYNSATDSIKQVIANMPFEGIEDEEIIEEFCNDNKSNLNIEDILFKQKFNWLKKYNKDFLFVIDGLDIIDNTGMALLEELNCKILITTRCNYRKYPQLKIQNFISLESQKNLFLNYYEDFNESDEDIEFIYKIIQAVDGHTLTLTLLALFLETSGYSPEELYNEIFVKEFLEFDLLDEIEYDNEYDLVLRHIERLFDLSNLPYEELIVLTELSYFPVQGISKRIFRRLTPNGTMKEVDKLVKKGWIINNKGYISLHPIVHVIVEKNRVKKNDKLEYFFSELINYLDMKSISDINKRQEANQWVLFLLNQLDNVDLSDNFLLSKMYFCLGDYLNEYYYWLLFGARDTYNYTYYYQALNPEGNYLDKFEKAINSLKSALDFDLDETKKKNLNHIGDIYSRLGKTYFNVLDYDNAQKFHRKALEIRSELLGRDHQKSINSRRRLGTCYLHLKDYENALKCYKETLQIWLEKTDDANELSKAYYDCGKGYAFNGNLNKALEMYLEAINVVESNNSNLNYDFLGLSQLYYKTAELILNNGNKLEKKFSKDEIKDFLNKSLGYLLKLDSEICDEMIDEIHILTEKI